jgi:hypothetical protein
MHITNVPLILTSLTFLIPFYAAIETQNTETTVCWGALTCTSLLLHTTKQPYHIHGPGNCIPWIYAMDVVALYVAVIRALTDGWYAGPMGFFTASIIVAYAGIVFYVGQWQRRFVYDPYVDMSIFSHASVHLLSSIGGAGVIYLRALKNGLGNSTL